MLTPKLDLTVPEVLDIAGKLNTNEEKIAYLRKYNGRELSWYINSLYNDDWSKLVIPDYKPSHLPVGANFLTIRGVLPRILIVQNMIAQENINTKKVDDLMLLVLENISKGEAELLVRLFKKQVKIDGLSKTIWKQVYPSFFTVAESN